LGENSVRGENQEICQLKYQEFEGGCKVTGLQLLFFKHENRKSSPFLEERGDKFLSFLPSGKGMVWSSPSILFTIQKYPDLYK
jgi:hypothetical protein